MGHKLIPIYRRQNQNQEGYTLLLDQETDHVYKVEHKEVNQYRYWITWALVLAFLRAIKGMEMYMNNIKSVIIVVIAMALSGYIAVYKYKKVYRSYREVYYTKDMIDYYVEKGQPQFKKEVITTAIIFVIFVILMVVFFIFHAVIWLLFSLFFFGIFIFCLWGIPLDRYKLYQS